MNYLKVRSAALRGLIPRQASKQVRRLQAAMIVELWRYERGFDSQQLTNEEWESLEIKRSKRNE